MPDPTHIDQLKSYSLSMRDYYKALSAHFSDSTNLPMFEDIVSTFDYSEIIKRAWENQKMSANFLTGSLVDTVHDIMAVQREFAIRVKTRASYFLDAPSDYISDADSYEAYYAINNNMFKGTSPDQI